MKKIIAICGSPRKEKTTYSALKKVLTSALDTNENLEAEIIALDNKQISGCISCGYCQKNYGCSQKDDFIPIMEKLKDENLAGIVIGSPVYMGSMTAQTKAFLDRSVLFRRNGFVFKDVVGGAITIGGSRNGGQELTLMNIHSAMFIHDMIIVGDGEESSHFGGAGWAKVEGGTENDNVANQTYINLGKRIGQVIKKLS